MNIDEFCQQMKKKTDLARQYNKWTKGGVWKMVITENEEAKVILGKRERKKHEYNC